jgi:hypothetical protein
LTVDRKKKMGPKGILKENGYICKQEQDDVVRLPLD